MIAELPYIILISGIALMGLWWANFFYDSGIAHWRSRKVSHFAAGCAALIGTLLFKSWVPLFFMAVAFTILMAVTNKVTPRMFRGTGGGGRDTEAMSEVWFPLSVVVVWGVGWGMLNKPLESTACFLMMAWGDCIGGWVRAFRYRTATKGLEGSAATLGVCGLLAWAFLQPLWLGLLVAIAATATEWMAGDVSKVRWMRWADDNFFIPVVAAAIYFGGLSVIGGS